MRQASFPWHRLKQALLQEVDVTQARAIKQGWGWRLSARIFDLKARGWPIEARRAAKGRAHYFLPKGWTPPKEKPLGEGAENKRNSQNTRGAS